MYLYYSLTQGVGGSIILPPQIHRMLGCRENAILRPPHPPSPALIRVKIEKEKKNYCTISSKTP